MQKINKSLGHPVQVKNWLMKNKTATWSNFPPAEKATLGEQLKDEQTGLCCYCCKPLSDDNMHIEHIHSRQKHPKRIFDYDNLLLSCKAPKHCGQSKGNNAIPLHPLMPECDDEIKIDLSGELTAKSQRAEESIKTLNLNNRQLNNYRKSRIDMLSFTFSPTSPAPPISILKQEDLLSILNAMSTQERAELEYLLAKLS